MGVAGDAYRMERLYDYAYKELHVYSKIMIVSSGIIGGISLPNVHQTE